MPILLLAMDTVLKCISLLFILTITSYKAISQETSEFESVEGSSTNNFEIVASIVNSHALSGEADNIVNELHCTYWFGKSVGAGLSLNSKVQHGDLLYDSAIIGSWSPVHWMTANVGPNISWKGGDRDFGLSAYIELEINFSVTEKIHIGPVVGGLAGEESEFFHGFHLGFEL